MMNQEQGMEGWEIISSYTRKQALEEGVLVDISSLAMEAGFRWSVAVTCEVWWVLEASAELKAEGQSWTGRAWDMLSILRMSLRGAKDGREVSFAPLFVKEPGGPAKPVALRAMSGPGDDGEPLITIMLPDED